MRNFLPLTLCACAFTAFLSSHALAQGRRKATLSAVSAVSSIEEYTREVNRYVARHQSECRIFADVASGYAEKKEVESWQEFVTEDARSKADAGNNLNKNADVCFKGGKVIAAHFMFQSPSRDWAHFVLYYFRADGTLAKIESTLNTFYGHVSARREKYFGEDGRLLRATEHFYELGTRKKTRPGKGADEFIDEPIPVFRKVSDLPFARLLESQHPPRATSVKPR